jgi:hypothetical protein
MCILKVSCSVFLNWVCWARGDFLASRVGPGWAGPVRIFLGNPLIKLAGLYMLFCLLGIVLACVRVILQVGGGGGGGGTVRFFLFFWICFGGSGTIEVVVGAVFKFSLSSVCC